MVKSPCFIDVVDHLPIKQYETIGDFPACHVCFFEPAELCRYAELPPRLDAAAQRHRMYARHGWCLGKLMGKSGYGFILVMDGYGYMVIWLLVWLWIVMVMVYGYGNLFGYGWLW